MHDLRSASVNNTRLAIIAAWHRLHPFLRYFSTRLFGEVAAFVASVKDAKKGVLPQARTRGHGRLMEQVNLPPPPLVQHVSYPVFSMLLGHMMRTSTYIVERPTVDVHRTGKISQAASLGTNMLEPHMPALIWTCVSSI